MAMLGVPYDAQALAPRRPHRAAAGGRRSPTKLDSRGRAAGLADKEVIALIAYLQRLGVDIRSSNRKEVPSDPPLRARVGADAGAVRRARARAVPRACSSRSRSATAASAAPPSTPRAPSCRSPTTREVRDDATRPEREPRRGARAAPTAPSRRAELIDHAYDGIHEYDNPLPGWWRAIVLGDDRVRGRLLRRTSTSRGWGRTPDESYQAALADYDEQARRCATRPMPRT